MDADLLERLNEIFGRCLETELKLPWILWAASPASGRTAVLRIHGAGKPYEVLAGDPELEDFALPLTIVVVDQRNEILPARIEVSGETTWALIPRPNHKERTRLRLGRPTDDKVIRRPQRAETGRRAWAAVGQ